MAQIEIHDKQPLQKKTPVHTKGRAMTGLVDCQSFYASCERIFRPDLTGKPIVVLSNNDHWIIALSPEAKALGLKRGDRLREAMPIILEHGVHYCSSNYTLYSDISRRVMLTLREICPQVETYSIDEAFVDLTGIPNLSSFVQELRGSILRQTFIPTTIGAGPTKSLAKIAQRLAKQHGGILVLETSDQIQASLQHTPIEQVWGIGRAYAEFLKNNGVKTALDFAGLPPWWVKQNLTTVGWRLQQELKGMVCNDLKIEVDPRKAIVSARQFGKPVEDLYILHQAAAAYAEDAWQKLRSQGSKARIIQLTLESSMIPGQGIKGAGMEFPQPTDYLPAIVNGAKKLLSSLFVPGYSYWRTTVLLFNLEPAAMAQQDFFTVPDSRHDTIMDVVENMNRKYGNKTIRLAASKSTGDWGMRRSLLSPRYTTCFDEFPLVGIGAHTKEQPGAQSKDQCQEMPGKSFPNVLK